ncbi:MarR family transcriptional regulator [Halorussus amylolyticus]|uniref:MarR family transcriptional regulator n=1 Tax=Halorussus amylolyticus TaxID=1126242 RepID=UPI00104910B9|nr:helix-turn-helix domain-containing protein [Halorussus amylolyticus]
MPVSRKQFETFSEATLDLSAGSAERRILSFLDGHDGQAFTQSEIGDETSVPDGRLGVLLRHLEAHNLVEHRGEYWAIGDESRIGSLAGVAHGFAVADDRYPPEDASEWEAHAVDPRK